MRKDVLLRKLSTAWEDFKSSYEGLTDTELVQKGVTTKWSVRDIIGHVTAWEEETLRHARVIMEGGQPPRYSATYGGIDAFNALMMQQKRSLSLPQLFQEQDKVHRRLIRFIREIPDEELATETRLRRRIRLDTYSHYPIHARVIRAWRTRKDQSATRTRLVKRK